MVVLIVCPANSRPAEMAAQKEKTARERELLLEDEVHSLRAANKTLLVRSPLQSLEADEC